MKYIYIYKGRRKEYARKGMHRQFAWVKEWPQKLNKPSRFSHIPHPSLPPPRAVQYPIIWRLNEEGGIQSQARCARIPSHSKQKETLQECEVHVIIISVIIVIIMIIIIIIVIIIIITIVVVVVFSPSSFHPRHNMGPLPRSAIIDNSQKERSATSP